MTIFEKLLTIQQKLKAPKGQYNSFGKYYYRSCEDILEAVKPLCNEQNAVLLVTDNVVEVGGRIYVMAEAMLRDLESDQFAACRGFAREDETKKGMDAAQITGCASSYARKYALNGLFCIDDAKDADALPPPEQQPATSRRQAAANGRQHAQQPIAKITSQQQGQLEALAKQKGVAIDTILQGYKLSTLQDMDGRQWAQAMNGLRKKADA